MTDGMGPRKIDSLFEPDLADSEKVAAARDLASAIARARRLRARASELEGPRRSTGFEEGGNVNVPSLEQAVHGDHRHAGGGKHEARRRDGDPIARLLGSGSEGTVAFVSLGFCFGHCSIQPGPKLRVGFGGVDARTYFERVVFCSQKKPRRCAATTKV